MHALLYGLEYVVNVLVGLNVGHVRHQLLLPGDDEMACRDYIIHGHLTILCVCSGDCKFVVGRLMFVVWKVAETRMFAT